MIQILAEKNLSGYCRVSVSGHAPQETGQKGWNLLCAGISAIFQTLFLFLYNRKVLSGFEMKPGDSSIAINPGSESETEAFIEMALTGFYGLKKEYPEFVIIRIEKKE